MIESVLVVCIGNICRSPIAVGIFGLLLPQIRVESAGLGALIGRPAEPFAVEVAAEHGIDITDHRARQLAFDHLKVADLVLVMDGEQKGAIEEQFPQTRGRVFRLGQWSGEDIPDPYQQPRRAFEDTYARVYEGVSDWQRRI